MTSLDLPPQLRDRGVRDPAPAVSARSRWLSRPGAAGTAVVLYAVVAALLAVLSDGVIMDDDLLHFIIAREAAGDARMLLDIWGRPGFTIPYAAVAWIGTSEQGFMISRLLSVAITSACAWLTFLVAQQARIRPAWSAPVLLLMMPLFFASGFTTTTEIIAAFYAILATWLLARGNHRFAAVVAAMLPITRHELVVLLVPLAISFLWRRDLLAMILLTWAEAAWNGAVWFFNLRGDHGILPIQRFFNTGEAGALGTGGGLHYLVKWIELSGVVIMLLSLLGALLLLRQAFQRRQVRMRLMMLLRRPKLLRHMRRPFWRGHLLRLLVAVGALGVVSLHTYLYAFNSFQSGGYARFLIPAAPWMAICAASALLPLSRLLEPLTTDSRTARVIAAAVIFIAVTAALLHLGAYMRPHRLADDHRVIQQALADVRQTHPAHHITASTMWVDYFLDRRFESPWPHYPLPWAEHHPQQLLYFFERAHGKPEVLAELQKLPHRLVKTYHLPGADEADPPQLTVYERLH